MKITFLGLSEAFHEVRGNPSFVIEDKTNMIVDCGFNIPQRFWQRFPDKDFLDAAFVSHFHADHVMGLPMLTMRMRQDKRTKPMTLIGPENFESNFKSLYELTYKGFFGITGFGTNFVNANEATKLELPGLKLSFANANHLVNTPYQVPTLAIRIESASGSICYSSDTSYSENLVELAKGCDILLHDSYMPASAEYHKRMPAHCSPLGAGKIARLAGVKRLMLFNIHRSYENRLDEIISEAKQEFSGPVEVPAEGSSVTI